MAVPMVHEQVHQRAGQDQQPRQDAENVRSVLGQQEEAGDYKETDAYDAYWRAPKRLFLMLLLHGDHAPRADRRRKKL